MAVTNFSPLLGLALPTTGDLQGTWGTVVNNSITSLIDSAVAGTTTLSVDADVTLTTTLGGSNTSREAILLWVATNSVTRYITAPAQSKAYIVINAGTAPIVIRGAGPTTGVTLEAGTRALVAWNGIDYDNIISNPVNLNTNVTGVLPAVNGGTGLSAVGTPGNVLTSNGTTWVSSASGAGSVSSVAATVPSFLSVSGSPITTSGTLAFSYSGTPLPVANGGTGATTLAGANIAVTNAANTFSSYNSIVELLETATITASAPASTTNFDVITQAVQYYTVSATNNFTLNIRGNSSTSLNSIMAVGQSATIALLVTNGATAYYPTAYTIDSGSPITPKWQGGTAPAAGDASAIDSYSITIIKTASATFTVLASQTKFA